ncbi:hypothetical protein [Pseudonocardia sp. HH130630-07]|uniref:hypothetical protein n=1 Tax=Pseudonocardia sp. HH130630-07 TaxID=1690815 RepID=UPI000814F1C0|nr:hypothetical protein [Pseudonocardia sp. HH130630-07]ANY05940.1 hypothetical protein AFB00_06070 [Pseudonocardia sp. HH130630-07]
MNTDPRRPDLRGRPDPYRQPGRHGDGRGAGPAGGQRRPPEPPTRPVGHGAPFGGTGGPARPPRADRAAPGVRPPAPGRPDRRPAAGSRRGAPAGADRRATEPPPRRRDRPTGGGTDDRHRPPSGIGRLLRGLGGLSTGGLVVLTAGLCVVAWLSGRNGVPGPGTPDLVAHLAATVVAVGGQIVADRRGDRTGTLVALGVIAVVGSVLGFGWFL